MHLASEVQQPLASSIGADGLQSLGLGQERRVCEDGHKDVFGGIIAALGGVPGVAGQVLNVE